MFETATSTLEYRPEFGRRVVVRRHDGAEDADTARSVDASTAELRQRVLAARKPGRLQIELFLAP